MLSLRCSFGVSEWREGDGIDTLLKRADMALYEAKLGGRDCVVQANGSFASPGYQGAGRLVRATPRGQ
jgi:predicted signal transduction protein with EAL and GGDEF domain